MLSIMAMVLVAVSLSTSVPTQTPSRDEINQYITEVATQYEICPELIMAMVETESNYDVDAENGDCKGLMQVSIKWHKDRMDKLGVTDLMDPYSNILVGADYLAELSEKYEVGLALMIYNGGYNYAMRIYEKGELSSYATKILERSAELEVEHGK